MDFDQLRQIDNLRTSKTSLSDSLAKEINEMRAIEENAKRNKQVRQREQAITADINARMQADKNKYGTSDKTVINQIAGKGPWNPDFAKLAKLDPAAAKAELAEVESAMGRTPDATPNEKFFKGMQHTTEHGDVPYFTNFPSLADQSVATQVPANVSDLTSYNKDGTPYIKGKTKGLGGNPGANNPMLDQKFRMAHERVEAPARTAKDVTALSMQAADRSRGFGVENTLKWLDTMVLSGKHEKRGVDDHDIQRIGADLLSRARTASQLSATPDTTYFLPLSEVDARPGVAAQVDSPATILNPGGGKPLQVTAKDRASGTISSLIGTISDSTPGATRRMQDYSARKVSKSPFGGSQIGPTVTDRGGKRQRTRAVAGELGYDVSGLDDMMASIYNIFGIEK